MAADETPVTTPAPAPSRDRGAATRGRGAAGSAALGRDIGGVGGGGAGEGAPRAPEAAGGVTEEAGITTRATTRWIIPLVVAGLVLAALNLRPAITSLGALLEEVRAGLGMSGSVAGLLTSVPPLCFAAFGVIAPRAARRWGAGAVVCAGMAAIATGLLIRPWAGGTAGFLAASALALAGIAVSNVLMPVIVKRWFPGRVGSMTGLYSMAVALGTALAAALTVPITEALGGSWRAGLMLWALPAVLAAVPWLLLRDRRGGGGAVTGPASSASGESVTTASANGAARRGEAPFNPVRSRIAWSLACFFGLQATAAYITMGWLPQIFRDAGVPASTAGVLLAVTMGLGVPLSFVLPQLAARMRHQGMIAVALGLCGLSGYAGLQFAPATGAWAWAVLLGISNCAFPLVLTLIGMRSRTGAGVVGLSAFVQSTGYLISIPGPLLVGVLYQHSGGWGLPLALMTALMVPQIVLGFLVGRNRTVEDEHAAAARAA
ncbi:MFS transporter [Streptomyces sp. NPDC047108]|uniref:CynX/NimT family MFS transporter n=1 Tax=Streptomyces sp. NPDC047108 TaxID=3155025 RepID=UPI0034087858